MIKNTNVKKILVAFIICSILIILAALCYHNEQKKKIEAVEELISKIGTVSVYSEKDIEQAEIAYDNLKSKSKKSVKNYDILIQSRKKYDNIKKVINLIDDLGNITLDSEYEIIEAEYAYENLEDEDKKAVINHHILEDARKQFDMIFHVSEVEKAIEEAGKNEHIKIKDIKNVRDMYENLSEEEKLMVKNYDVLIAVESEAPMAYHMKILEESEYWDNLHSKLRELLRKHNLFITRIDSRIPYYNYHIEVGVYAGDNKYRPTGITEEKYVELFETVKQELYGILDEYAIEHSGGLFGAPSRYIVGLIFYNRFNSSLYGYAAELGVASYQVDVVNYYYNREHDRAIVMDEFSNFHWQGNEVYKLAE